MLREEDIQEVLKSLGSNLSTEEILNAIRETTPEISVNSRKSLGSPNPRQEQHTIRLLRKRLSTYAERIGKRRRLVDEALQNLTSLVINFSKKV